MAIALDSVPSASYTIVFSTSATRSHTCSGDDRFLIVYILDGSGLLTSVTYDGVAMTLQGSIASGQYKVYTLENPNTGTNNIVATASGTQTIRVGSVSYTGVGGIDTIAVDDAGSSYPSPYSPIITTGVDDAWIFMQTGMGTTSTASGANTTFRAADAGVDNRFASMYDTNGAQGAAGVKSMAVSYTGTQVGRSILISLAPVPPPTPTTFSLTVNASKVAATLTDYPAYVDLSEMPSAFWAEVTNGGGDIRCYSDSGLTTELAREVVSCDTVTDTGEMHVKVPSLTTSSVIYVTVDGTSTEPAVGATYGRNAVWSDYAGVYHMEDTTTTTITDSTGGGKNGTKLSAGNPTEIAGQVGEAQQFDGSNDYIDTSGTFTGIGDGTLSAWVNPDSTAGDGTPLMQNASTNGYIGLGFYKQAAKWWFAVDDKATAVGRLISPTDNVTATTWQLLHGTWDSNLELFKNGVSQTTKADNVNPTNNPGENFTFGNFLFGGGRIAYFDGNIDEVRIRTSVLSNDWITTEYNNQNDVATFWTIAEEGGGGGVAKNAVFFGGGM